MLPNTNYNCRGIASGDRTQLLEKQLQGRFKSKDTLHRTGKKNIEL